jgi:hypothetical protein
MPAKNGKGGKQLKQKYAVFVGRMTGPKTESAMAKVLSIGMTGAKELAPLEYGTLMNSAFRRIEYTPTGIKGIAGFSGGMAKDGFNYALYLHQNLDWKPRPPALKSGPGWNQNAKPKFLERGFTDPIQISLMQKAIGSSYKL